MICGKIIFATQEDAVKAIDGMQRDNRPTRVNRKPRNAYFCKDCNGWHVHSDYKKHKPKKVKTQNLDTQGERKQKYAPEKLIIRNYTSKPIK